MYPGGYVCNCLPGYSGMNCSVSHMFFFTVEEHAVVILILAPTITTTTALKTYYWKISKDYLDAVSA